MGRPKRLYPLGKFRLRVPKQPERDKAYPVELEYTWNRQILRRTTNVFVKVGDWNQAGNNGRGVIRSSYGPEYAHMNQILNGRVERIDYLLAEYNEKHPHQITAEVIMGFLADKPLTRKDQGKDFVEFTMERLESDYSRNRIGRSRYMNGKCCMNVFTTFLRATKQGTYEADKIYVGDITPELIDSYIEWRREIKQNGDETINHALTPIIKSCAYASELGMISSTVNARIQDMRIVTKPTLSDEEAEFDGKSLTKEQMSKLLDYYKTCTEWQEKRDGCRYVFNLVKDDLNLDDAEALYKARNNATKCINQSLVVVGENIGLPFNLSMHVARHTFAVFALNKGLSMSVVSRLLGHGSTDVTEKVYARFLPETLASEVAKLKADLDSLEPI